MQSSEPVLSADGERLSNGQLVERFASSRDESAFAELVRRFGPMVLGVTRRLLNSRDDADDATQLVFTELARRAGTIRTPSAVGGWLHTVAVHAAFRLRKRQPGTTPLASDPVDPRLNLDELARRSAFEILSEELDSLPELWREPLVLRYLSGLSNEDAAAQLGTTVSALEGRLKRGKKSLRVKLLRRGVAVASLLAAVGPVRSATAGDGLSGDGWTADDWDCVTDAAQELASDPSTLTFVPMETPPMTTTLITFKAAVATGVAAVVLTAIAGPGHQPGSSGVGTSSLSTIATGAVAAADAAVISQPAAEEPDADEAKPGVSRSAAAASVRDVAASEGPENDVEADPFGDDPFGDEEPADSDPFASSPPASSLPRASNNPFGSPRSAATSSNVREFTERLEQKTAPSQTPRPWIRSQPQSLASRLALNATPIDWEFFETPLEDTMEFISESERVQIWIDEQALSELGYSVDEPVTVDGQFRSLSNGLTAILGEHLKDLDFVVRDDRLIVTTAEAADTMLSTMFYPVPNSVDPQVLVDAITTHVIASPRGQISWSDSGGNGHISVLPIGSGGRPMMVVTQSDRGHAGVAEFIDGISSIAGAGEQPVSSGSPPASVGFDWQFPQPQPRSTPGTGEMGFDPGARPTQPQPAKSFGSPVKEPNKPVDGRVRPATGVAPQVDTFKADPAAGEEKMMDAPTNARRVMAERARMTIAVYDLAELSSLLYGDNPAGGLGGVAGGMGGSFSAVAAPTRQVTWDELKRLAVSVVDSQLAAEFLVQRGSQIFVKASADDHRLLRETIDSLTKVLKESGAPQSSGPTNVVEGGGFF